MVASEEHDFIVKMIQIKMKRMGYKIIFMENRIIGVTQFRIPPKIISHRPDIIGYRKIDNMVCIGEAKYLGDLKTERTKKQIRDFISISKENKNVDLILGIPLSEKSVYKQFIKIFDESFNFNEKVLLIPDRLIRREDERV